MVGVMPMVARKGNGNGERSALAAAITKARQARTAVSQHHESVGRAERLVSAAQNRLAAATTALEDERQRAADVLRDSASTGKAPAANGAMKAARMGLADAGDELEAAEMALTQLKKGGRFGEVEEGAAQAENQVLVQIAKVLALTGGELLAQAQRKRAELLVLREVLYALTGEEIDVPLFGGEIARLNGQDARRAPLVSLREEVLKLSSEARPEELAAAREAVKPYIQWRRALRTDPDNSPENTVLPAAPEPEL